ncbi:MAG: type II secretion system F family protein [Anaerolineales bacterium]|jgi:tight adherence protein B|uniref:type II secretion system F family protein n=1 Tax=Candidatus Villigracilis affinis TaxID=3140682 RepID=UPI001B5D893D|nr:type II secretion system F family protein [Anaerolineales bacterium]MBK9604731.1 type II secretion system F family protein [Anaerolineales bacterium]MBL0345784.1 type II secretion system F family protein [Anaerolineales bacterium]MBP8047517.1 type II secretion system F family protein [Anaerolineales bacterium]
MATFIIIGGVVLIILLIVGVIVSSNSERAVVEQRLAQYLDDDKQSLDREAQNSVLTEWVSKRVEKTSFGDRIARDLARADLKFKAGEYFILIIVCILIGGLVIWFLGNQHWASAVMGAIGGAFAPGIYVRRQQKQRLQKFNDQLSDMLNLMVNGLRAGYSTMQAMEAVSKELPSPINDEFRRVVQEMQIGIPMETALENLLRRIPSDDLDFVVTAINVQREVGGNLSEILDTISFTIRERVRIKGEVRVLTAQVRTSGSVLSLIPFFLVLILWFLNPEYIMAVTKGGPIITAAIICVVLGLIFTGYFIMMKIADIEV